MESADHRAIKGIVRLCGAQNSIGDDVSSVVSARAGCHMGPRTGQDRAEEESGSGNCVSAIKLNLRQ